MCCFSRSVPHVSQTRIFARPVRDGRQRLAYAMRLVTREDVAMILPLPVPPGSAENAVRFIDLSALPKFFESLERGFPRPQPQSYAFGPPAAGPVAPLVVHDVGQFEASFVPTVRDFERLDPRFRLPTDAWSALPAYADWGFAVFKLRAGAEMQRVHPMALELPRRDPSRLFFPTVHIHDGAVHATAEFDHTLYAQLEDAPSAVPEGWALSAQTAEHFFEWWLDSGMVDALQPVLRHELRGVHANGDVWIDARA
jgi:hypothetical protein